MKKFVIRFFGSGISPEYTGIVASMEIMAQDKYCAIEIARRMLGSNNSYYTGKYDVVEIEEPHNWA